MDLKSIETIEKKSGFSRGEALRMAWVLAV